MRSSSELSALAIIKRVCLRIKHGPREKGRTGRCEKECLRCMAEDWIALQANLHTQEKLSADPNIRHCDDYITDATAPRALRFFLLIHRLPAVELALCREHGMTPKLFADFEGKRVRVVMASRLGDVGITSKLHLEGCYELRVPVAKLSNFDVQA